MTSHPPAWDNLAALTCATHKKYAERHGYDYYADRSDLQDNFWNRHTGKMERVGIHGFVKLDLFLHYLPKYQYVAWLDADLLVTNYDIPLQGFRSPGITLPFDFNGHNATVIIAHSTDLVYDFFWACNNSGRKMFLGHDWYEMEAMRYFSQTDPYRGLIYYESIKELCPILGKEYEPYVPERVSKKYSWEPGDWTCHLSAFHIQKRVELAQRIVDQCKLL